MRRWYSLLSGSSLWSRGSLWTLWLAAVIATSGCYNPHIQDNPDANMGFHCFATDTPPCPQGLLCCANGLCGAQLLATMPNTEGWCLPPAAAMDMTLEAANIWDFGPKAMNYTGEMDDPMLLGPACTRAEEPNDLPSQARSLGPLIVDKLGSYLKWQICPDKSAPNQPDYDAVQFTVSKTSNLVAELDYAVNFGDLDIALFQETNVDGVISEQLLQADLGIVSNGCITQTGLTPGNIYYVVVHGAPNTSGGFYLNNYLLRVSAIDTNSSISCTSNPPDGGL